MVMMCVYVCVQLVQEFMEMWNELLTEMCSMVYEINDDKFNQFAFTLEVRSDSEVEPLTCSQDTAISQEVSLLWFY